MTSWGLGAAPTLGCGRQLPSAGHSGIPGPLARSLMLAPARSPLHTASVRALPANPVEEGWDGMIHSLCVFVLSLAVATRATLVVLERHMANETGRQAR